MSFPAGWDRCELTATQWSELALRLRADWSQRVRRWAGSQLSLLDWSHRYLARHFVRPGSRMHLWLAEQLDEMIGTRGLKLNVIGPRGGAKSTIGTLAYVLRAAVEGWEPYIWIVSDTRQQADLHLANIKAELIENAALAADYPQAAGAGSIWRRGSIRLANGVTIDALGTLQRVRGQRVGPHRPSLILCDDVQNDQHIKSALERDNSLRWFEGTLLKAGNKRTNIVNLATALHRDALALTLHRTPGWNSRVFKAIERWPDQMSLWHQWEAIYCDAQAAGGPAAAKAFYAQHRAAMDEGAELLWPCEEDLYTLMCMRVEGGRTAFEREKQGTPLAAEQCEWSEDYFDEHIWFDQWPLSLQLKVVALDPSKGRDAGRGDYSAYVLLGIDDGGAVLVDADLARRATPEMVAAGVEICRQFRPQAFGVESNQYQELLAGEFAAEFRRQEMHGIYPWSIDNHVNKLVRIRRLGPLLSGRQLRFKLHSPSAALLVEQLKEFPHGDHDDGPDALEMALRLAGELTAQRHAGDGLGSRLQVG